MIVLYYVEYSNNGWEIYYDGEFVKRKFIANQLSKNKLIDGVKD